MTAQLELQDRQERHEISEATCKFLCHFASGDLQRPLPQLEVDWADLLQEVIYNGLVGIVYYYIRQSPLASTLPASFAEDIHRIQRLSTIGATVMNHYILKTLKDLNRSGIEYLVVKGPVLAHDFYPHPTMRIYSDLDIIVHERDWTKLYNFMGAQGFEQAGILPPSTPKFAEALVIHETRYIHAQSNLQVEVHYDDFVESGLVSRNVDGFWKRRVSKSIEGVVFQTLSLEDHLLYLCAHIHYHGYTRLKWLSDIGYMIQNSIQLNWNSFINITQSEEACIPAYYTLKFTREMLDVEISDYVLEQLRPDWLRQRFHEFFMPEHKIRSLKPMVVPDLRFHFRPFFRRTLPSFLVMGRRHEKLQVMAQILMPSEPWLRHYYNLDKQVWITPYYLRRLAHLLVSSIREIGQQDLDQ